MYCSKCGEKSNNTAVFCTHCGNELKKIKILYEDIYEGIQLKPKKISCFFYVLLFLFTVTFCAWFLVFAESNVSTSPPIETLIMLFFTRIICLFGILGGLFASIYYIKITIENKPIIIVDQNGITNNSAIFSNRRYCISWDNIEKINIMIKHSTRGRRTKFVRIYLKQPFGKHSRMYISLALTGIKYEDFLQQVLEYKKLIGK